VSSVQATELEPATIQIDLTGGDTKNVTINVTGVETIYLEHEILPDGEGINVTYPLSINPLETQFFNMTINVAIHIAPDNYTIILKYYYEDISDESSDGRDGDSGDGNSYIYPFYDDPDDDVYPIIHPKPKRTNNPYIPTSDEPEDGGLCYSTMLLAIFVLVAIITVLYLKKFKKGNNKAEKPGNVKK